MPAFRDGGNHWIVRFAPPLAGTWSCKLYAAESLDAGVDDSAGTFQVKAANFENPLYSYGEFLKVAPSDRFLTCSDFTHLAWLGDTCWFFCRRCPYPHDRLWLTRKKTTVPRC